MSKLLNFKIIVKGNFIEQIIRSDFSIVLFVYAATRISSPIGIGKLECSDREISIFIVELYG